MKRYKLHPAENLARENQYSLGEDGCETEEKHSKPGTEEERNVLHVGETKIFKWPRSLRQESEGGQGGWTKSSISSTDRGVGGGTPF